MTKFKHEAVNVTENKDNNALEIFFDTMLPDEWELISCLPFQRITKNNIQISGDNQKVELVYKLIFKKQCLD